MNIRNANRDDMDNIRQLVLALSHFYLQDKDAELPAWFSASLSREEFSHRIESSDFENYLCENEMGVVGYIAIKNSSHLYHLFVAEDYQRRGVARALWQHARKNLEAVVTVRSSVFALPVYKKLGFVESGSLAEKDGILFQPMVFQFKEAR